MYLLYVSKNTLRNMKPCLSWCVNSAFREKSPMFLYFRRMKIRKYFDLFVIHREPFIFPLFIEHRHKLKWNLRCTTQKYMQTMSSWRLLMAVCYKLSVLVLLGHFFREPLTIVFVKTFFPHCLDVDIIAKEKTSLGQKRKMYGTLKTHSLLKLKMSIWWC